MRREENSKQKILTAATNLFAHKGFDAVSIREICKQADVNVCMVSYYFGGKQELYNAIIDDLIEKQTQYTATFFDFSIHPRTLVKQEQVELLVQMLDRFVDFFYLNISGDLILFFLKEQQNPNFNLKSPAFKYLRKVIAAIFELDENSKEAVYLAVLIISQVSCLRVFPAFSIRLFEQTMFDEEDIRIVKSNVKRYVRFILQEQGIECESSLVTEKSFGDETLKKSVCD